MKINIYYGGRGLIDDPTLYVINKMETVLKELHVTVEKIFLHEHKKNITSLPTTLKEADGIILATTIEWYGVGGLMQQFLDACWLYGDKKKIAQIYMCAVVMATAYGEREGKTYLENAWEILGGMPCNGLNGYVTDTTTLEMDKRYEKNIEKVAENLYRIIHQKAVCFPASNQVVKQKVCATQTVSLTPQETEQLSQYVSDDNYVQKTKEDIKELTNLFRNMMGEEGQAVDDEIINCFKNSFTPLPGIKATYRIRIDNMTKPLIIEIVQNDLLCEFKEIDKADVEIQLEKKELTDILDGKISFQKAFMSGAIKMKGDFAILRNLDLLFQFEKK